MYLRQTLLTTPSGLRYIDNNKQFNNNPYFEENFPIDEWHLCRLFISPKNYKTINEVIDELNKSFHETFTNLYQITTYTTNGPIFFDLYNWKYEDDKYSGKGRLTLTKPFYEIDFTWDIEYGVLNSDVGTFEIGSNVSIPPGSYSSGFFGGDITLTVNELVDFTSEELTYMINGVVSDCEPFYRVHDDVHPLLRDLFHWNNYQKLASGDTTWVKLLDDNTIEFSFDIIPVHTKIMTTNNDFRTTIQSKNYNENKTVKYLPKLVSYYGAQYHVSKTKSDIVRYNYESRKVENYYSKFSMFRGLFNILGFNTCTINADDILNPFIISGRVYCEQFYSGIVKDENTSDFYMDESNPLRNNLPINRTDDILSLDASTGIQYYYRKIHSPNSAPDLCIANKILVNVTQLSDIEKILNIHEQTSSVETHEVKNEPQLYEVVNINKVYTIPKDTSLYFYLTSTKLPYPLSPSPAFITIEYI